MTVARQSPTRDEIIEELGRVRGLLDCLAALVDSDTSVAREMARAVRGGDIGDATRVDLGPERITLTGWVVRHLAEMLAAHLDETGATNHCAWAVHFPAVDGEPARSLDLVAQWSGGLTTGARIARAEQERDDLRTATCVVAAALTAHDTDPSEGTQAALDVALTTLFALVPGPTTRTSERAGNKGSRE